MDTPSTSTSTPDEMMDKFTEEARQKWGDTEAFRQSQERVTKLGKEGLARVMEEGRALTREIATGMQEGNDPKSAEAQALIVRHYAALRAFYEPNLELYRGLAEMYIADERFAAGYEKVAVGLAQYMHDAMVEFVGQGGEKK